jgi:hypothetical protein
MLRTTAVTEPSHAPPLDAPSSGTAVPMVQETQPPNVLSNVTTLPAFAVPHDPFQPMVQETQSQPPNVPSNATTSPAFAVPHDPFHLFDLSSSEANPFEGPGNQSLFLSRLSRPSTPLNMSTILPRRANTPVVCIYYTQSATPSDNLSR